MKCFLLESMGNEDNDYCRKNYITCIGRFLIFLQYLEYLCPHELTKRAFSCLNACLCSVKIVCMDFSLSDV